MARGLIALHEYCQANPTEWVDVTHYLVEEGIIASNSNVALLRHWGLLEAIPDAVRPDGSGRVGLYRMTQLGFDFVRGQIKIPKYATLYNQELLALSTAELINIRDALGSKFDYDELMSTT